MDNIVESLNKAYENFVLASANVFESKDTNVAALENFKEKWELFRAACDQAEGFVESVKQSIGSDCTVDEATGITAAIQNLTRPSN